MITFESNNRCMFLDNVRTLVVILVIILHAACAYAEIIPWWPVQEFPKEIPYTIIILILDLFCMPLLFFVSGYFAPQSLGKYGVSRFVVSKFKRLGIPFVLLGFFYVPIMSYIGYVNRTPNPESFFNFWLFQMGTALTPTPVLIDSAEVAIRHASDFSQWHLWFITLLLGFFLIYALGAKLYAAMGKDPIRPARSTTPGAILLALGCAGVISTALVTLSNQLIPAWSWFSLGGYIMLQPSRLGLYFTLFALGIFARNRNWFASANIPGSIWVWLALGLVADMIFLALGKEFQGVNGIAPFRLAFADGLLRSVAALFWTAFFIKAGQRWMDVTNATCSSLCRSSYDLYLLHLPVVVGLQLLATLLPTGFFPKFTLESVLTVLFCWAISRKLIAPQPRLATGVLFGVFLGACLVL